MKVYQAIASAFIAMENCNISGNNEWFEKHEETIENICINLLPHGSGFDCGTQFNFEKSTKDKLVFNSSYHHMDENGFYDGWSELTITVKPDWNNVNIHITGIRRKNRYDKDYFYDTFYYDLTKECDK